MICAGPDLVLPYIRYINSIFLHFQGKLSDKLSRIYIIRIRVAFPENPLLIFIQRIDPLFMILTGDLLLHEILENAPGITHDRNGRQSIFTDLR